MPDVLIVEDSPTTGPIVRFTLGNAGFECACVAGIDEAIAAVDAAPPLVVVTDVRFPVKSGFTLSRHLRANHPSVGILMISGYDDLREERDWYEGANDAFLAKPFKLNDLVSAVQTLIAKRRGVMLRYRPRAGDRLSIATSITAGKLVVHRSEMYQADEVDAQGAVQRVTLSFPERWEQMVARREHPLHGKRAQLAVQNGVVRPHGLMVPSPALWPESLIPEFFAVIPEAPCMLDTAAEGRMPRGKTKATLRAFAPERRAAIVRVEIETEVGLAEGSAAFRGAGDAVVSMDRGVVLEAGLEGTLRDATASLRMHSNLM
jgi:DNA-binding response OmpR family regulator